MTFRYSNSGALFVLVVAVAAVSFASHSHSHHSGSKSRRVHDKTIDVSVRRASHERRGGSPCLERYQDIERSHEFAPDLSRERGDTCGCSANFQDAVYWFQDRHSSSSSHSHEKKKKKRHHKKKKHHKKHSNEEVIVNTEAWWGQCPSTLSHVSLFIDRNVIADAGIPPALTTPPSNQSCAACSLGTQYIYAGFDGDANSTTSLSQLNPIGLFYCADPLDFCIETEDGRLFKAVGNESMFGTLIYPYCRNGRCHAVVVPLVGANDDETQVVLREVCGARREITGSEDLNGTDYLLYDNYNYLKAKAISCNGCRTPIEMCDNSPCDFKAVYLDATT